VGRVFFPVPISGEKCKLFSIPVFLDALVLGNVLTKNTEKIYLLEGQDLKVPFLPGPEIQRRSLLFLFH
jgi:hypothetical protein